MWILLDCTDVQARMANCILIQMGFETLLFRESTCDTMI